MNQQATKEDFARMAREDARYYRGGDKNARPKQVTKGNGPSGRKRELNLQNLRGASPDILRGQPGWQDESDFSDLNE